MFLKGLVEYQHSAFSITLKVSVPEIQRLWTRFQQLGCNNFGVLPANALSVYDNLAEKDPHMAILQNVFSNF